MGRYYFNKKDTVEQSRRISMSRLRQWNYLKGFATGTLSWKDGWGHESSIGIKVNTSGSNPHMQLNYTVTQHSGEKRDYDYSVQLISTPCVFGGRRFWFICPLTKNGSPCNRKVSTLYSPPGKSYYGCRHCYDLTYSARQDHNYRFAALRKRFEYEKKAAKLHSDIKREHYAGKPTKKYQKYLRYSAWVDGQVPLLLKQINDLL